MTDLNKTVKGGKLTAGDRDLLRTLFGIDTRALAAVRVGLSLILIVECLLSSLDVGHGPGVWNAVVRNAWLATVPFGIMVLVGYRTRIATIAVWILFGIPIREAMFAPDVLIGLRYYTMVLAFFWMMFLPINAHFSVDKKRGIAAPSGNFLSVAGAGFLIQVLFIYVFSGVIKTFQEWLVVGDALHTILSSEIYPTALGEWITRFPVFLAWSSRAVIALEVVGSLLLFVPLRGLVRRRIFLVAAFIAMHIGMALLMKLGSFPLVMIVIWLVFLPGRFWDRLTGTSLEAEHIDKYRTRNLVAWSALGFITLSSLMTWFFYPDLQGFPLVVQQVGKFLLLYQQWTMFSVPSSI